MRAREVVLATGAIERPLVFPDNDRPAVMLADSARRYCNQYGAKVGDRVVVATAHDSAYRAALDLKKAGVHVELIADLRPEAKGALPDAARAAGIEVAAGVEILGADGRLRVKAVRIKHLRREANRRLRCAPDVGRLDALGASLLAIARQARFRRGLAGFQARRVGSARALGRRLQRGLRSCRRACRRRGGRARRGGSGRVRCAGRANLRRQRRCSRVGQSACRTAASRRSPRESLRRFPERRLRQGCEPRGAGGHALDRAHQALHHDRHGDRPGQALQHERAWRRRRRA